MPQGEGETGEGSEARRGQEFPPGRPRCLFFRGSPTTHRSRRRIDMRYRSFPSFRFGIHRALTEQDALLSPLRTLRLQSRLDRTPWLRLEEANRLSSCASQP